jgi:hypothetical protein
MKNLTKQYVRTIRVKAILLRKPQCLSSQILPPNVTVCQNHESSTHQLRISF